MNREGHTDLTRLRVSLSPHPRTLSINELTSLTTTNPDATVANRDDIKAMSSDGARLITAASDGDKKAVKAFLKNGVDVNSRCVDGWNLSLSACVCGCGCGFVCPCRASSVDRHCPPTHLPTNQQSTNQPNHSDWDQLTAVIAAASAGHLDMVKFLLDSGADVNAQDKDHITALMEAAIMGHKGNVCMGGWTTGSSEKEE